MTWKGEGVAALTSANFDIATRLVPPGECELENDDFSIFGTHYSGDYALTVTPIDTFAFCDWAPGSYVPTLQVDALGMKGSAIFEIIIT